MEIKLTIIIPVFNAEHFVESAVRKLTSLPIGKWEAVFIDDHSTDGTLAMLTQQLKMSPSLPVRITQSEGKGPGPARNKGISLARGDYLGFLDIDDDWDLASLLSLSCSEQSDLVIYNHQREYPDGRVVENKSSHLLRELDGQVLSKDDISKRRLLFYNFNVSWNKLCSRSFILKNNIYFRYGIYEDLDWSFKCITRASEIKVYSSILYTYVQHPESTLKKSSTAHHDIFNAYSQAISDSLETGGVFLDIVKSKSVSHFFNVLSSRRVPKESRAVFVREMGFFSRKKIGFRHVAGLEGISIWKRLIAYSGSYYAWSFYRVVKKIKLKVFK
ncbi:glycosyltransferase family 2 protein [Larsenimonas suaedae]|uniref:Glycosyltransferase n=1 Tax=Larsenimonas suaedae TaxID=1851019 RepID=A0ABU1GWN2_9GAMM|nr:glycosyltransferase family 2 protein [Larsenimonas suaedae]MCM2972981.1 glycosyltransferase [Larsenimonas suaedae]MDR5896418.1 glycosyltransferase [Larsenimonas suaedae]